MKMKSFHFQFSSFETVTGSQKTLSVISSFVGFRNDVGSVCHFKFHLKKIMHSILNFEFLNFLYFSHRIQMMETEVLPNASSSPDNNNNNNPISTTISNLIHSEASSTKTSPITSTHTSPVISPTISPKNPSDSPWKATGKQTSITLVSLNELLS
jgi:hypothetical protein